MGVAVRNYEQSSTPLLFFPHCGAQRSIVKHIFKEAAARQPSGRFVCSLKNLF